MDEASSKFLDKLVLEKLLEEKLRKVHHAPESNLLGTAETLWGKFPSFQNAALPPIESTDTGFHFPSPLASSHAKNNRCPVRVHRSPQAKANILLQHGLFEENRAIYDFLIRELLKLECNVFVSTLPYHYERCPAESLYSGEFFWSANFQRTQSAFLQAVIELHTLYRLLRAQNDLPTLLCGFSMGGCISLILASLCKDLQGVVAINPAASLSEIVWDSPLCATIKADYLSAGCSMPELQQAFRTFEPMSAPHIQTPRERIQLIYGLYDQVTSTTQYENLARAWNLHHVHAYKAGHMNTLRMPRLAQDIHNFLTRTQSSP